MSDIVTIIILLEIIEYYFKKKQRVRMLKFTLSSIGET